MSKRRQSKLYLSSFVGMSDLATGLCSDNTYDTIIELIEEIDRQQQDWEFTRLLKDLVDRLMAEEDGTRVGDRDDG